MTDFFKNKKIFITGHTGFKGAWLCKILSDFGAKITGYALPPEKSCLFNILSLEDEINNIYADIRDLSQIKEAVRAVKPDIIIHMAAQPLVRDSYKNPVYTYETNVMGTVNIMEAMRDCKSVKSFLNVTTDKVYKNIESAKAYQETDELNGRDPYSNSKSCSELVTETYKLSFFEESDTAISTARSGNVIGGGDFASDRIIPDCIRAIREKKSPVIRNPNSVRPYQHVIEALFGYLIIIKKQFEDKKYQSSYNIGPEVGDCITTSELVDLFLVHFPNIKYELADNTNEPHEACFLKLDNSKMKEAFNWKPFLNIKKSVDMTAEWTKAFFNDEDIKKITGEQIKEYYELIKGVL